MSSNLTIQDIRLIAAYKTGNQDITDQQAIKTIDSATTSGGLSFVAAPNSIFTVNDNRQVDTSSSIFSQPKPTLSPSTAEQIKILGNNDTTSVGGIVTNLIQKLGFQTSIAPQESMKQASPPQVNQPEEVSPEMVKAYSVDYIQSDVEKGLQLMQGQQQKQGAISGFYGDVKELFDTEYAASRVGRILAVEGTGASLLERANNNTLTKKDYYETKIELAARLLPEIQSAETRGKITNFLGTSNAADERRVAETQVDLLKKALSELRPEDLDAFITGLANCTDKEYAEKAPQMTDKLVNDAIDKEINKSLPLDTQKPEVTRFGSIDQLLQQKEAHELMSFEETFQKERGVGYNPQAIQDYAVKEAQMQLIVGMKNVNSQIKEILQNPTVSMDNINKYGGEWQGASGACAANLERSFIQALKTLHGDDEQKMNKALQGISTGVVYKDGKLDFSKQGVFAEASKPYTLVGMSRTLQARLDNNFEKVLNGKTFEDHSSEYSQAYKIAYGEKNGAKLGEAFIESQMKGTQYIKTGVQGAGMVAMIAGQCVPGLGQAATILAYGGLATATLGGSAIDLTEAATKQGGVTAEDWHEISKELATSVALTASGMGIGKVSTLAYGSLVAQNCPRLLALGAKVGADATMSMIATKAITGEIDLTSEGISQVIPIIAGVLHAKCSMKSYLNNEYYQALRPATNAHMNTRGTEFFDALSAKEKGIVIKNNITPNRVTEIHGVLNRKLTVVDTEAVIVARNKAATAGKLRYDSLSVQEKIAALSPFTEKMKTTPKEKKLVIVTGRGGSGKSTIILEQGIDKNHLLLDADEIKPLLPGYSERGAGYVHEVSTKLNEKLLAEALQQGTNVVLPTTGWADFVESTIKEAHRLGYDITLIHSDIKAQTSMQRAVARFEQGEVQSSGQKIRRYIEPANVETGTYVDEVLSKFKSHPLIKEVIVYDNNGMFPPKLVEKTKK